MFFRFGDIEAPLSDIFWEMFEVSKAQSVYELVAESMSCINMDLIFVPLNIS